MKIVNESTGELFDLDNLDLSTEQGLIDSYRIIKTLNSVIKKRNTEINEKLKDVLGDEDERYIGPYVLKQNTREIRSYPISVLEQFFDSDQVMECMTVSVKKVDQMSKILSKEDRKQLDSLVETTTQILPPKLI